MSKRPLIGILYSDCAVRDNEMRIRTYVSRKYSNAVLLSGGDPILLPTPFTHEINNDEISRLSERYLSLVDGILLAGGEDIHPKFQDEDPIPALGAVNPFRDNFEIIVTKQAYTNSSKPILGVCRGIQLMTVALGGKVHQDISEIASIQHSQSSPRWASSHYIEIKPNSRLSQIADNKKIMVNSFHHQAVKTLPKNFEITAKTSDGIIEAIELEDKNRFCLGVQWHPEETFETDDFNKEIFKIFVNACK